MVIKPISPVASFELNIFLISKQVASRQQVLFYTVENFLRGQARLLAIIGNRAVRYGLRGGSLCIVTVVPRAPCSQQVEMAESPDGQSLAPKHVALLLIGHHRGSSFIQPLD